jgi:predicted phosphoribosyltransferase
MFEDRRSAGRRLAARLRHLRDQRPLVLALPRGGVPVAVEVAAALGAQLDLVLVRKIGVPWQPELALGAIVDGPEPQLVYDARLAAALGVEPAYLQRASAAQLAEIERRRRLYFGSRKPIPVRGRAVILVDDGIATGATARAAIRAVRQAGAARVILATPVAPADTLEALRGEVDEIVCLEQPSPFLAIGNHYVDFGQLDDAEVVALLGEAGGHADAALTRRD